MAPHAFLDDELRETAALYVLGSLPDEDARRFRLHLAGCPVCRDEVAALGETADALLELAPASPPPPRLFERVLERVRGRPEPPPADRVRAPARADTGSDSSTENRRAGDGGAHGQIWKGWNEAAPAAAFTYVDADAGAFEPTSLSGVFARRLFVDAAHDRVTMLVRMEAGSSYPAHRHAGPEDCYVLAGDLDTGERAMRAGDFVRSAPGSRHAVQSTRDGCLLLIVSSLGDELIA